MNKIADEIIIPNNNNIHFNGLVIFTNPFLLILSIISKPVSTLYRVCFSIIFFTNAVAENVRLGVEGGLVWADIRAEETAQTLANLSGSTVTYTYDEGFDL